MSRTNSFDFDGAFSQTTQVELSNQRQNKEYIGQL